MAVTPELVGGKILLTPTDYTALREGGKFTLPSVDKVSGTPVPVDPEISDPSEQYKYCIEKRLVYDALEVTESVEADSPARSLPVDLSTVLDMSDADTAVNFKTEQLSDETLKQWWKTARDSNRPSEFYIHNTKGLLYRKAQRGLLTLSQLALPLFKRQLVMQLAHESPYGGHLAKEKVQKRLELNFTWPSLPADVRHFCDTCRQCQLKRKRTWRDLVPIEAQEAPLRFSDVFQCDLIGPLDIPSKGGHHYVLVLIDLATGWVDLQPLRSLKASELCDNFLKIFAFTGIPRIISSDNGPNFRAELTTELYNRFGIEVRFGIPLHPQSQARVERTGGTVKRMLHHLLQEDPKPAEWATRLPLLAFCLREMSSDATGTSAFELVFGHPARGILSVLHDTFSDSRLPETPVSKPTAEYLDSLRRKLVDIKLLAEQHRERKGEQREVAYNQGTVPKSFEVGDLVIYLVPTSTNRLISTWSRPGTMVAVKSRNSYLVSF